MAEIPTPHRQIDLLRQGLATELPKGRERASPLMDKWVKLLMQGYTPEQVHEVAKADVAAMRNEGAQVPGQAPGPPYQPQFGAFNPTRPLLTGQPSSFGQPTTAPAERMPMQAAPSAVPMVTPQPVPMPVPPASLGFGPSPMPAPSQDVWAAGAVQAGPPVPSQANLARPAPSLGRLGQEAAQQAQGSLTSSLAAPGYNPFLESALGRLPGQGAGESRPRPGMSPEDPLWREPLYRDEVEMVLPKLLVGRNEQLAAEEAMQRALMRGGFGLQGKQMGFMQKEAERGDKMAMFIMGLQQKYAGLEAAADRVRLRTNSNEDLELLKAAVRMYTSDRSAMARVASSIPSLVQDSQAQSEYLSALETLNSRMDYIKSMMSHIEAQQHPVAGPGEQPTKPPPPAGSVTAVRPQRPTKPAAKQAPAKSTAEQLKQADDDLKAMGF